MLKSRAQPLRNAYLHLPRRPLALRRSRLPRVGMGIRHRWPVGIAMACHPVHNGRVAGRRRLCGAVYRGGTIVDGGLERQRTYRDCAAYSRLFCCHIG